MINNKTWPKHWREIVLAGLLLANLLVWAAVIPKAAGETLKVYFLDVGQGDAIFIETPSRKQVLIDGGKNRKVVSELGQIMTVGDRSIDVLIATHPDADHIGGLPEVVSRFKIGVFVESPVPGASSLDEELHARLVGRGVASELAQHGQVVDFGDGARLTVLFPSQDVSRWETNDASIVARLDYGSTSFLFTGDATIKTESTMIYHSARMKELLDVDVLKVGHHGSRTSTALHFAEIASPEYAVISAGKDNTYGHPHPEVVKILQNVGAQIVSTIDSGTMLFETDGKVLKFKD